VSHSKPTIRATLTPYRTVGQLYSPTQPLTLTSFPFAPKASSAPSNGGLRSRRDPLRGKVSNKLCI
jgi:hypothetical protein